MDIEDTTRKILYKLMRPRYKTDEEFEAEFQKACKQAGLFKEKEYKK